jgi:para-nitrobenzyl esterase
VRNAALFICCLACGGGPGTDAGIDAPETVPDAGDDAAVGTDPRVETSVGTLIGSTDEGVDVFRGIPYAEPPIGALRFARPVAHAPWTAPLDTRESEPLLRCPQIQDGAMRGQEDCLTLNVYAPQGATGLPVMVFIHGGAFIQGSGNEAVYDGVRLASRGVVLVTLNYRLGTLGFLATPEMVEDDGGAGNFGLWDQRLALEWVRDHIESFGGDASNVTIFGESAGAVSVLMQMVSPGSSSLFARVIMESGGGGTAYSTQADALADHEAAVAAVGCDGSADVVACLRAASVEDLIAANGSAGTSALGLPAIGPHVDGAFLPGLPYDLVASGAVDVPFMVGSNADEATVFTRATTIADETAFRSVLSAALGATVVDELVTTYDATSFGSWKAAYNALFSDIAFICPALALAIAGSDGEPAYTYHFTRVLPGLAGMNGSFHGLELFYVFGNTDVSTLYRPNADDAALVTTMQTAWVSYATDGAPTFEPGWTPYDTSAPDIAIFDEPPSRAADIRDGRCDTLRALGLTN